MMALNEPSSVFGRMDFNKSMNSKRIIVSLTVLAAISYLKHQHWGDKAELSLEFFQRSR